VAPLFLVPGTPGWHWQRKYPVPGKKKDNDGRYFSLQELEVLVAEHDGHAPRREGAAAARSRGSRPRARAVQARHLGLARTYLQARGWTINEASSDDAHRTWRKSDGGVCYTHADGDAEVMAGDVESVAIGEECSVLRVLVGLMALGPLM